MLGSLIKMRKWGCQCQSYRPSYVEVVVDKMQGLGAPAQPESHLTALQNSVLEIAFMSLLVPLLPQNCSKLSPMNFALWLLPWYHISSFWLKPRSMPDIAKFNFLLWYSIFWTFWSQRLAVSSSVSDFDIFGTIITPCYSRYYLLVSPGPNPFLRSRAPPLRTLNCARIYLQP